MAREERTIADLETKRERVSRVVIPREIAGLQRYACHDGIRAPNGAAPIEVECLPDRTDGSPNCQISDNFRDYTTNFHCGNPGSGYLQQILLSPFFRS